MVQVKLMSSNYVLFNETDGKHYLLHFVQQELC